MPHSTRKKRRTRTIADVEQENKALEKILSFFNSLSVNLEKASPYYLQSVVKGLRRFLISGEADYTPVRDVPISETVLFMSHNAYNIPATGVTSLMPNQTMSLTEQLKQGIRGLELDVYKTGEEHVLCHGICNASLAFGKSIIKGGLDLLWGANRKFVDALTEIKRFADANPSESVILKLEDHIGGSSGSPELAEQIKTCLGQDKIFTAEDFRKFGRWPSLNELVKMGKQYIFTTEHLSPAVDDPFFINVRHGSVDRLTYTSSYAALEAGLAAKSRGCDSGHVLEIGEDQTTIGRVRDSVREVLGPDIIGRGGGEVPKEVIQKLQRDRAIIDGSDKRGVVVGLDHIDKKDPRFLQGLLINLGTDCRYYVPAAVISAAVAAAAARDKKSSLSEATVLGVNLLVHAFLPLSGQFLYHTIEGGVTAFSEQSHKEIEQARQEVDEGIVSKMGRFIKKAASVVGSGVGHALAVTAKLTMMGVMAQIVKNIEKSFGYVSQGEVEEIANDMLVMTLVAEFSKSVISVAKSDAVKKAGAAVKGAVEKVSEAIPDIIDEMDDKFGFY